MNNKTVKTVEKWQKELISELESDQYITIRLKLLENCCKIPPKCIPISFRDKLCLKPSIIHHADTYCTVADVKLCAQQENQCYNREIG